MAYATLQDAKDIYGEEYVLIAADRDANGEADTTALAKAFDDASSEIDSYLAKRYAVPLSAPIPAVVRQACVDIALYRVSHGPGSGLTDEKRQRYEDVVKWLVHVSKGVAVVADLVADGAEIDEPQLVAPNARRFTRMTFRGLR